MALSAMSTARIKKLVVPGLICLGMLAPFVALRYVPLRRVEIRGNLSPVEIAAIIRSHQSNCPPVWAAVCPKWFPVSVHRQISGMLSPIEIIAVPGNERAIVVYRGFEQCYYDKRGKHRWGLASYKLAKDAKGWHMVAMWP